MDPPCLTLMCPEGMRRGSDYAPIVALLIVVFARQDFHQRDGVHPRPAQP